MKALWAPCQILYYTWAHGEIKTSAYSIKTVINIIAYSLEKHALGIKKNTNLAAVEKFLALVCTGTFRKWQDIRWFKASNKDKYSNLILWIFIFFKCKKQLTK